MLGDYGTLVEEGVWDFEPQLFAGRIDNENRHWGVAQIAYGLTDSLELQVVPTVMRNDNLLGHSQHLGDTAAFIGYQLFKSETEEKSTYLKFALGEIFPTGRYRQLNETLDELQATGEGAYQTVLSLNFQHQVLLSPDHRLNTYITSDLAIPQKTQLIGVSRYGGASNTRGHLLPGNLLDVDVSFEYEFSYPWIVVMSTHYIHRSKTSFSGNAGTGEDGNPATVGLNSTDIFSFIPSLEYSAGHDLAFLAGYWFSVGTSKEERISMLTLMVSYTLR